MRLRGMDQNSFFLYAIDRKAIKVRPTPTIKTSLAWPDLLRRALSIRDDKCPREIGLVQVVYQTRSLTLSTSRGVNGVLIDIALKSNINTMGT